METDTRAVAGNGWSLQLAPSPATTSAARSTAGRRCVGLTAVKTPKTAGTGDESGPLHNAALRTSKALPTERVRAASNGKQTPWVARREMFGEFFVVPAKK
jgi:hypothetical protein